MLSLSPAKLLVILVIALIVLGPEKLPQVARQIGAAWHDLREWRSRIESEVRGAFPNMPPTHEVAQAVRSPLAFLDRLADEHERALDGETTNAVASDGAGEAAEPGPDPPGGAGDNGSALHNGSAGGNGSGPPGAAGAGQGAGSVVHGGLFGASDDPSMN